MTVVTVQFLRMYFSHHNPLNHRLEIQHEVTGAKCVVIGLFKLLFKVKIGCLYIMTQDIYLLLNSFAFYNYMVLNHLRWCKKHPSCAGRSHLLELEAAKNVLFTDNEAQRQ